MRSRLNTVTESLRRFSLFRMCAIMGAILRRDIIIYLKVVILFVASCAFQDFTHTGFPVKLQVRFQFSVRRPSIDTLDLSSFKFVDTSNSMVNI